MVEKMEWKWGAQEREVMKSRRGELEKLFSMEMGNGCSKWIWLFARRC